MNIYPVTDRILKIRTQLLNTPMQRKQYPRSSYGNHPHTLHWLRGYLSAKNADTTLMRRSLAQAYEMENSKVIINDDELLVGQPDFFFSEEEKKEFMHLYEMFRMAPSVHDDARSDHTALDYRKLLRIGIEGLLSEINNEKSRLTFSRESLSEDIEKEDFYNACIIELRALITYAENYEAALREKAALADGQRREELLKMADNMHTVPRYPAKTFWQALQSIHFYTFTLRGLYASGRPDQDLIAFYNADIEKGILTPVFAQELVDNYCLSVASYIAPDVTTGLMIGGTDEDGNPVENPLTWMFLTSIRNIRMSDPNIGLCVSRHTSDELIRYALSILREGHVFPSFWNDDDIVKALIARGYDKRDAHRYINSTCVELTIIGKNASWTTAPYHNLAQILLDTLHARDYANFESLKEAFFAAVKKKLAVENHRINHLKLERTRNASEPMLHSCLIDDCIKRGKPVGNGGAIYNQTLPNFLGFANAIDGLSAIQTLVFEKQEVSLSDYKKALLENYIGYEDLRNVIIHNTPHYGNDIPAVDAIAAELADCIQEGCESLYTFEGAKLIPGIFSFSYHVMYGKNTPATPDGRLACEPLSDSAGPAQGKDTTSPTAALRSGTGWKQCRFTGGVAQNIKLTKSFFDKNALGSLVALIRSFNQMGGCELQLNTVDREILEDAILHPNAHRDLLVRVGGYCDFFTNLPANLQREIIDRTEY